MILTKRRLIGLLERCETVAFFDRIHALWIVSSICIDELIARKAAESFSRIGISVDVACKFLESTDHGLRSSSCSGLISGYAAGNAPAATILAYRRLIGGGFLPVMYTFPPLFKSFTNFFGIGEGRQLHATVLKLGFSSELFVQNSMLYFYSSCGENSVVRNLFDQMPVRDVISWTSIISGFTKSRMYVDALIFFSDMDVRPKATTLVSVLVACGKLGDHINGRSVHGIACKSAFVFVLAVRNALLDSYMRCECHVDAQKLFDEFPDRDVVSWTVLITGLARSGLHPKEIKESIYMLYTMVDSGIKPDPIILTCIISACSTVGDLDHGRLIHEFIGRAKIEIDIHLGTSLIDMYGKCGRIDTAIELFDEMRVHNVYSWNSLLNVLAMHGFSSEIFKRFHLMLRSGVKPNEVSFLAVLSCCRHSGLINEGVSVFSLMASKYNAGVEHYGCMVDMLCRAGMVKEAMDFIRRIPIEPDARILASVFSSCSPGEDEDGAFEFESESEFARNAISSGDGSVHVLMSNMFARKEKWNEVGKTRELMRSRRMKKVAGFSSVNKTETTTRNSNFDYIKGCRFQFRE